MGICAGAERPLQLSAGDNVEAGAERRHEGEHADAAAGLHRVADKGGLRCRGVVPVNLAEGVCRINIKRRAVFLGKGFCRDVLSVQDAVSVIEFAHCCSSGENPRLCCV